MPQMHRNDTATMSQDQSFPLELRKHKKTSSMLFTMLPAVVQSHLSQLPSIRKSVTEYGLASRHGQASADTGPYSVTSSTRSQTPDADYTSALVLSNPNGMADEDVAGYSAESTGSDDDTVTGCRGRGKRQMGIEMAETKSGIEWKFANQGLSLLSLAVEESSMISQNPTYGNASFARQLYIHALTYLLQALPHDMTAEEQISVRGALPAGIVKPLNLSNGFTSDNHQNTPEEPSLLHRTLASTIIQLFILVQFILPYMKYFIAAAYQYDREHKISEQVLRQGIDTVDCLGKTGLNITGAIYSMGDGKVGQVITESAAWIIEGFTGGLHEGLGEGMVIMGVGPRRAPTAVTEKR